ncbi:hypothetical protein NQK81_01435 [Amycolatopsis roodepoortensis]|uniref:hypothetical protein n=1 Tax=Amycolatopsis roodepoortensis TaxID=700274 RepID=UPI00214AA884|nr:hypothetical protein [Amycolatopsis roodepoortensis]UUV32138.1 hypothetical protein NQK81_01435 [Amycolatopsis roodepoortensis]
MSPRTSPAARDRARRHPQARLLADRTWLALAALAESDPANVVADELLAAAPSVQKLSLHNQVTLLVQAGEQQILLRDVDTEAGWARRGRVTTPQGLRVVRPHDKPGWRGPSEFRVSYRWDFAQTKPADGDIPPQATPAPAGDPADLAGNLIDQLGNHAYRVTPATTTVIDHHTCQISIAETIWHDDPATVVRVLIPALAHVLVSGSEPELGAVGDHRAG